jgi:hypothetical protein
MAAPMIAGMAASDHLIKDRDHPEERNVNVADGHEIRAVCRELAPFDFRGSRLASRAAFDYRLNR